jgi:hypothetical protein
LSYICPVCNGMQVLDAECPICAHKASDCGRFDDFLGPYSPYREIDDIAMSNGFRDVSNHLCIHLVNCPVCAHDYTVQIELRNDVEHAGQFPIN